MTATPQIVGYEFDQRLLEHPLAEVWRGRSFTGMEVVALVLSEAGAADPRVRERLVAASRSAAVAPGRQETPLWAANLTADRPYAITQLMPGQSGAERLFDPLDGLLGNDEESLNAVRHQLAEYGAVPPPPADLPWDEPAQDLPQYRGAADQPSDPVNDYSSAQPVDDHSGAQPGDPGNHPVSQPSDPSGEQAATGWSQRLDGYRQRLGGWAYLVVVVAVLIIFSVTYSIGAAIGSAVKDAKPISRGPAPAPVSPGPLPSPVLKPGIVKVATAPYQPELPQVALVGETYPPGTDLQLIEGIGLPFAFGWPRPPTVNELGESSYAIYRRVLTGSTAATASLDARITVHPCRDLAGCLRERAAFDEGWTTNFKAPVPATAKGGRTWLTVRPQPYALTMTHAFTKGGRWWLVGVLLTGADGEQATLQRVLNDIRTQAG